MLIWRVVLSLIHVIYEWTQNFYTRRASFVLTPIFLYRESHELHQITIYQTMIHKYVCAFNSIHEFWIFMLKLLQKNIGHFSAKRQTANMLHTGKVRMLFTAGRKKNIEWKFIVQFRITKSFFKGPIKEDMLRNGKSFVKRRNTASNVKVW